MWVFSLFQFHGTHFKLQFLRKLLPTCTSELFEKLEGDEQFLKTIADCFDYRLTFDRGLCHITAMFKVWQYT